MQETVDKAVGSMGAVSAEAPLDGCQWTCTQ